MFSKTLVSSFLLLASLSQIQANFFPHHEPTPPIKAIVYLRGPEANSTVTGSVVFEQASGPNEPVKITGTIKGLTPSALRGFHVHQSGNLTDGCTSTGAHYNPKNQTHGAPNDTVRHVGDLGNVQTDANGVATLNFTDKVIQLTGPYSILGRGVVVHAGTDDLGKGNTNVSLSTGNAGTRAACGVIGLA
ncbi:superoxide dismutase [Crepidotus variabilis]|uniref:Superoxide dismutase [Cu-Zn] n=1 Tax=Crepidotus variabilis TaxID=179855 RepID=A0A9P6ENT6_9AGAR|nr:superoxide dismutase [Crepidotus variabilis]